MTAVEDPERGMMHNVSTEKHLPSLPITVPTVDSRAKPLDVKKVEAGLPNIPVAPNGKALNDKSTKAKKRTSRWISFQLWFNTYR